MRRARTRDAAVFATCEFSLEIESAEVETGGVVRGTLAMTGGACPFTAAVAAVELTWIYTSRNIREMAPQVVLPGFVLQPGERREVSFEFEVPLGLEGCAARVAGRVENARAWGAHLSLPLHVTRGGTADQGNLPIAAESTPSMEGLPVPERGP